MPKTIGNNRICNLFVNFFRVWLLFWDMALGILLMGTLIYNEHMGSSFAKPLNVFREVVALSPLNIFYLLQVESYF